jgi:hypothetical protein
MHVQLLLPLLHALLQSPQPHSLLLLLAQVQQQLPSLQGLLLQLNLSKSSL